MKDDREGYCCQILDTELQKRGFARRDWETPAQDPPDRWLTLAGRRFAVEMTSTPHQTTAADGGSVPSEQYDELIVRLIEDLRERATAAGSLHGTFCLSVFKPFASCDYRKHRETLLQLLLIAIQQLSAAPEGSRWEPPWQYMDTVELWKVASSGATILRSAVVCQGIYGAVNEPEAILKAVVDGKHRKLIKGGIADTPILAVLNTYDLLDGVGFRDLASSVPESKFFEAVFFIDRFTGLCTELTDSVILRPRTEAA